MSLQRHIHYRLKKENWGRTKGEWQHYSGCVSERAAALWSAAAIYQLGGCSLAHRAINQRSRRATFDACSCHEQATQRQPCQVSAGSGSSAQAALQAGHLHGVLAHDGSPPRLHGAGQCAVIHTAGSGQWWRWRRQQQHLQEAAAMTWERGVPKAAKLCAMQQPGAASRSPEGLLQDFKLGNVLPADAVRQQAAHLLPHQLAHLGGRQRLLACTAMDRQRERSVHKARVTHYVGHQKLTSAIDSCRCGVK